MTGIRHKLIVGSAIAFILASYPQFPLSAQRATTVTAGAAPISVPFVGCKSDGQLGPQGAPKGKRKIADIPTEIAKQVAYYRDKWGAGVLAPRGWHCFGTYGSDGDSLYISPLRINTAALIAPGWPAIFSGPVIQVTYEYGDTSGRFGVAAIIARVFPAYKDFVRKVMNEDIEAGISPPNSYVFGPYPTDKLTHRGKNVVEYTTPANSDGLGTQSRLVKNSNPINGVAILVGRTPNLLQLSMRLPKEQRDLGPFIIQQVERDAAHIDDSE